MRSAPRLLLFVSLLAVAALVHAQTPLLQREVLVQTTPTFVGPFINTSTNVNVQNIGPQPLFCTINPPLADGGLLRPDGGALVELGKGHRLGPDGGEWHITRAGPGPRVTCITPTNQVTGGGTILSEW